jgi:8-oxo-dGTP pyrophosphatase MutT (NUDIX family)
VTRSGVPIRQAATVLLLRDGNGGLEVYMVKRSSKLGFLGGAHVFPGGAVDAEDRSRAYEGLLADFDAHETAAVLGAETLAEAQGYVVAAFRELFEEAGILLARRGGEGSALGGTAHPGGDELTRARGEVVGQRLSFAELLRQASLELACRSLGYFAHWITPDVEVKRFDTRFFLAEMPAGQQADFETGELVDGVWIRPGEALVAYAEHQIELVPPTICSLDRLRLHETVAEAFAAARTLPVVEVRPKIAIEGSSVTLLYPGDDDYDSGVARPILAPGRQLDRLVLRDGIWVRP